MNSEEASGDLEYGPEEKARIVARLNQRYGTTLDVDLVEIAVSYRFTTWAALLADTQKTRTVAAGSSSTKCVD